ncbi:MAG: 50S ribosomal protein L15 [Planctomycetota bacterium]|jgi:large subunit ribosomal protein L15
MNLKSINRSAKPHAAGKRIGRGTGSGRGKTCGKGHKGQKCRSGYKWHAYFEGGQMPLYRRLPKKGFNNGPFRKYLSIINVGDLNRFPKDTDVDPKQVQGAGMVKNLRDGLKVLGKGKIEVALTVKAHAFSDTAVQKIQAAGGTVIRIGPQRSKGKSRKP